MANAVRLESPYVIGSDTINDGDYITLSITDTNDTSVNNDFGRSVLLLTGGLGQINVSVNSTANYAGQPSQSRSITLSQNLDTTLYVNNDVYALQPQLQKPTITYNDLPSIGNGGVTSFVNKGDYTQTYNDPPVGNNTYYTQNIGASDVIMSPRSINTVRAQNWYNAGYPTANGSAPDPSEILQSGNTSPTTMLTNGSATVGKTDSNPPLLCVELHDDDYMALRSPTGKYLHLLPAGQADASTLSGVRNQVPQSLVLSFSDLPSNQYTAQWSVYLISGAKSQVVLLNRGTNTCLTLDDKRQISANWVYYECIPNKAGTQQFFYNYIYSNNAPSARLYYDGYTTMYAQWWDTYMQQYYRLTGSATIDQAGGKTVFTMKRVAINTCIPGLNPLNSVCISSKNDADSAIAAAIVQTCRRGDMFTTPSCQTWAIANPDLAQDAVLTYCTNNPNDLTFCGCQNMWPFTELRDYLSLTTPPTVVYAECNLMQCQPASAWKSTSQKIRQCVQSICAQGINFNGTISDSTIRIKQDCTFNNNTPTSSDGGDKNTTQMTSPFLILLNQVNELYERSMNKLGSTQLILVLLIITILFCIMVIALPQISIRNSSIAAISCGFIAFILFDL